MLLAGTGLLSAETIGFNFQNDNGAEVTGTSFGIPAEKWINLPRVANSGGAAFTTSTVVTLPTGGTITVEWSAKNTYHLGGGVPAAAGEDPGADQVVYGYLDDTSPGYQVKLTGMRNAFADFKVTLIAASDNASGFTDAQLMHSSGTDTLTYGVPDAGTIVSYVNGGVYALTPPSESISTVTENNTLTITAAARSDLQRATLAGFIVDYSLPAVNKPVIEVQPAAPAGPVFSGDTVTFTAQASGGSPVTYQWRKNGVNLAGKTDPVLTISPAAAADSGSYDVVATNSAGSATSNVANLTVTQVVQPSFTASPLSQTLYNGYPASFSAAATGGQLTYSWKKDGTVIAGADSPVLKLASITAADAGTYMVTAANSTGSASASATLTVIQPQPGTYEAVQASLKPLLWYRYSETAQLMLDTGTAANSGSVGAAGDGVAKRYVVFQSPGALAGDPSTSAGLKGSWQFINIPWDAALNPAVFTAELWVKPPPANNGRIDPLINRGENAGDGFLFFGWNGVTKWQFRCYSGTNRTQVNSDVDIVPGQWTHLVGVYDGTTAHLFVNGVEQSAGTVGQYVPNTAMPMRIGSFPNDSGDVGGGNFAGGAVDEVAIYSTVLTPAQILEHYQNGMNPSRLTPYSSLVHASSPKGYWRMDDAAPAKPTPANNGTAGAAWAGDYGGIIIPAGGDAPAPPENPGFPAANKAVDINSGHTSAPPLNITTNTLTVTTWIKRAEKFTTGDLSWPAWLAAGGGFHLDGTSGRPYAELRYHWDGDQWDWGSGLQVPADIWTFCAMVLEPDKTTIYMGDGDNLRSSVHTNAHTPHQLVGLESFGGNQPGADTRNFIGQLDESAFYDRALSRDEIASLFITGSGAPFTLTATPGGVLKDTKSTGTPLPATNYGASWLASDSDGAATRDGVLQFPADVGGKVVIPADPAFSSASGTIMFWLKTGAPTGSGNEAAILFDHRTGSGAILGVNAADGDLFFQTAPGSANTFYGGTNVTDGLWHHVAVTWDQNATGSVSIYLDGAQTAAQANTAAWSWPADTDLEIGQSHDDYWKKLAGMMDDFRVYNQALTAAQIASVISTGGEVLPAALAARYDFSTVGDGLTLTWPFGILETSTLQTGDVWMPAAGAVSPWPVNTALEKARFYRAKLP